MIGALNPTGAMVLLFIAIDVADGGCVCGSVAPHCLIPWSSMPEFFLEALGQEEANLLVKPHQRIWWSGRCAYGPQYLI
jgi:hypothetical protein